MSGKNRIQNLVRQENRVALSQRGSIKTAFKLVKPKSDQTTEETITLYSNNDCVPVQFLGILND